MYETYIIPRKSELNGYGHIGNTVIPVWLEEARHELFQAALASMEFTYMLVNLEQNFSREIQYGSGVLIKTGITRIGNSSVSLVQEVWQDGALAINAQSVAVHVNKETSRSTLLPPAIRDPLSAHIIDADF